MIIRVSRWWPFVLRSTFDQVKTENYTLRDALREANNELRKHRALIGGLRSGHADTSRKLETVLGRKL